MAESATWTESEGLDRATTDRRPASAPTASAVRSRSRPHGPDRVPGPDQRRVDQLQLRRGLGAAAPGRARARSRRAAQPEGADPVLDRGRRAAGRRAAPRTPGDAAQRRVDRRRPASAAAAEPVAQRGVRHRATASASTRSADERRRVGRGRRARRATTPTMPHMARKVRGRTSGLRARRQRARPAATSRSAAVRPSAWSRLSTITRTSGSVPDGRTSTRPSSPSSSSTSRTRLQNARVGVERLGTVDGDVAQHLRQPGQHRRQLRERPPRRAITSSSKIPVSVPSPVVAWSA